MARFRLNFVSDCIKDAMDVYVVVPQKKHVRNESSPEIQLGSFAKDYPLLILLHDEASSPSELLNMSCVERFADTYGVMIVVPQGILSYYTDYTQRDCGINAANSAGASSIENDFTEMCYESFIMETLDYIHRVFRVSQKNKKAYIGGIGMGGFGALKLAFKYPDKFSAAFSISGDVDIQWKMEHEPGRKEQFLSIFGGLRAEGENDLPGVCEKMANNSEAPRLFLICDKTGEHAVMHQQFINRVLNIYPCLSEEMMDEPYSWAYIDAALDKVFKWL